MITGTIHEWANSIGIARETLETALSRAGIVTQPREQVPASSVFKSMTGDRDAAMTRKLNAEAESKERENRMEAGETITVESALEIYGKMVAALVQDLDSIVPLVPGLSLEQRQIATELIEKCKAKGRAA